MPPVAGALLRAALVASCFLGASFAAGGIYEAVCLVLAIAAMYFFLRSAYVENVAALSTLLLLKHHTGTRLWCHEGAEACDWLMSDFCA